MDYKTDQKLQETQIWDSESWIQTCRKNQYVTAKKVEVVPELPRVKKKKKKKLVKRFKLFLIRLYI